MSEIYWLLTIGNLNNAIVALFVILNVVLSVILIVEVVMYCEGLDEEEWDKCLNYIKKTVKYTALPWLFLLLGIVFVPSKRDLYAIYGIGGTIDYIKQNDTAKQLPDKVVNYLDKWIESELSDKEKNE